MGQSQPVRISFRNILKHMEEFITDCDMSFFIDKAEYFMKGCLKEEMTEEEAIDYLETQFLFNHKKSKSDILTAADVLRAIRMIRYRRTACSN